MSLSSHGRKALVLGAGGKVGRLLARVWQRKPPAGLVPVFQHHQPGPDGFVHWQEGDAITDLPRADAVIALWGATPGRARAFCENTRLALLACEIARRLGAERLFLASSAAVYGGAGQARLSERSDLPTPPGAYGQSKLEMERAVAQWSSDTGPGPAPRICALRLANIIGADSLFCAIESGDQVTLDRFASGAGPVRSYLTVGDLAHVLETLVACPCAALPAVLNVAGNQPLAMADLARAAGAQIAWRPAPATATERVELETSRLTRLLGAELSESSAPGPAVAALRALEAKP